MNKLKKAQLQKIWKQLDGACEALERLGEYDDGEALLESHENRIDFSAIISLRDGVEELIEAKSRKKGGV